MPIKDIILKLALARPKVAITLTIFISLLSAIFLPQLDKDFSYRGFYDQNNKYISNYKDFVKEFSGDDTLALYFESDHTIFSKDTIEIIKKLTHDLETYPNVIKVTSLSNYVHIHSEQDDILIQDFIPEEDELTPSYLKRKSELALKDRIIPGYLVSKDLLASTIILKLRPSLEETIDYTPTIVKLESLIKELAPRFSYVELVGSPLVSYHFQNLSLNDLSIILPLFFAFVALVIYLLFKQLSYIWITSLVLVLSILSTFSFAAVMGIQYNNIVGAIPIILLAISIADCIHFFSVFNKKIKLNGNVEESVRESLSHIIFPTFLTSFSTCIGFLSLTISEILPISGLGALGAFGTLWAWLLTIFMAAPITSLLSIKFKEKKNIIESLNFTKLVDFIDQFKVLILIFIIFLTASFTYIATLNTVDSDPLNYIPEDHPFRVSTLKMEEKIGGVQGIELVIDSKSADGIYDPQFASHVNEFVAWLEARPPYSKVLTYTKTIKQVNQYMSQGKKEAYILPNLREKLAQLMFFYELSLPMGNSITDSINLQKSRVRITGMWDLHNSYSILKEFDAIELKLKEMGLKSEIRGKMPIFHNMNNYVVNTFFTSIVSAIILISLMMVIIFKSFKIGLISLLPNVFPLLWGGAFLMILGKNIDMGTVVVCAICMGIAVDDTIHFLSTYAKKSSPKISTKQAIVSTLQDVGIPLCSTTLILVTGFLFFILGDFMPNRNLGIMTAFILTAALLMDLILLPTILLIFNKPKITDN